MIIYYLFLGLIWAAVEIFTAINKKDCDIYRALHLLFLNVLIWPVFIILDVIEIFSLKDL